MSSSYTYKINQQRQIILLQATDKYTSTQAKGLKEEALHKRKVTDHRQEGTWKKSAKKVTYRRGR